MKVNLDPHGAQWALIDSFDEWVARLPLPAAAALMQSLEEGAAVRTGDGLRVEAGELAKWSEPVASSLGLPPNVPLGFDIRLAGAMGKPGAALSTRWLQPGKTLPARDARRDGPWMEWQGKTYRIPSPMWELIGMAERFNAQTEATLDEQFRLWAGMRAKLGEDGADTLTDGFLRSLRVVTASAVTFGITTDDRGDIQIEPVLLSERPAEDGDRSEHVRALTEHDERLLSKRVDQLREGAAAFPISQGTYVVVDTALQETLRAVRRLRQAPAAQRKRAAMYPDAVIREVLGLDEAQPTAFVETEKFADRVLDVGEWSPPVVPWIKIASQQWGSPEAMGVRVGGVEVALDKTTLAESIEEMQRAIESRSPFARVGDQSVAATPANLHALKALWSALERSTPGQNPPPSEVEVEHIDKVLIIETNFEETSFQRVRVGARPGELGIPSGLRTAPKPHQVLGIEWLQQHWIRGSQGAMLCDDMGLGKTFQALAFCLWLRELATSGSVERRPLLLVAPVGLLRNWEQEILDHLMPPGLGRLVRAYGEHLRALRRGSHVEGNATLDTAQLSQADVVLANYEAVSDYQLSFGAVPFLAVVLDEAQKIKSPRARMTHAAKALHAEFTLAMTGTPVENRLADLWCIADTVQPGSLEDLRAFSAKYEVEGAEVSNLRAQVWQEEQAPKESPPKLILRRLKSDKLEGLPRKHEHVHRVKMPARQLEAYFRALAMKELSGPEGTLGMIHALRRISLHPLLAEGGVATEELDANDSARMLATLSVLDEVAKKGEKALVFLESLDLQEAGQLPMLLQRRYQLKQPPMVINGQVSTEVRQVRVTKFQTETGFDVMLLSPKAGGVGLTLTAANHVIHLSRWWNPAVEDQCSDRVYRIGQKRDVHIHYPLAVLPDDEEASFDMQLQLLMDRKRQLAQNLLAAPSFTRTDYEQLLSKTARSH